MKGLLITFTILIFAGYSSHAQGVVVNPDGTHSPIHGNVAVNPDGTHSVIHGTSGADIMLGRREAKREYREMRLIDREQKKLRRQQRKLKKKKK